MKNMVVHRGSLDTRVLRLAPTERRLLALIGRHEGKPYPKEQMAVALGRSKKTVNRLVSNLRREGLIETEAMWGPDGGQLANVYRLTRR